MTCQSALAGRDAEKSRSRHAPTTDSVPTGGSIEPMSTNAERDDKSHDSSTESNNPHAIADQEFVDAVAELAAAGATDIGGGVPPAAIADAVDCAESTARQRLPTLVDDGALVQEWGFMPIGSRPRRSYLPGDRDE